MLCKVEKIFIYLGIYHTQMVFVADKSFLIYNELNTVVNIQ